MTSIASTATTCRPAAAIMTVYIPMLEPMSRNTADGYMDMAFSITETLVPSKELESSIFLDIQASTESGLGQIWAFIPETV